jgi:predicted transcriptional regulator
LDDEIILQQLEVLLLQEEDWWDELTETQKESLRRGLEDAKNGRVYPFEEVMAEFESKR